MFMISINNMRHQVNFSLPSDDGLQVAHIQVGAEEISPAGEPSDGKIRFFRSPDAKNQQKNV